MKIDIDKELVEHILEKMFSEESCLRLENYSVSVVNLDSTDELKNDRIVIFTNGHNLGLSNKEIIIRKNIWNNIYNTLLSYSCDKIKIDTIMNSIDFCTEEDEIKISLRFKVTVYGKDEHIKYLFYSL